MRSTRISEKRWLSLAMMFLIYTFDLMGMAIVFVVFASLILDHNSSLVTVSMPVSSRNVLIGFLFAAYPITQFFGAPIFGEMSDRFGRRPILLISTLYNLRARLSGERFPCRN